MTEIPTVGVILEKEETGKSLTVAPKSVTPLLVVPTVTLSVTEEPILPSTLQHSVAPSFVSTVTEAAVGSTFEPKSSQKPALVVPAITEGAGEDLMTVSSSPVSILPTETSSGISILAASTTKGKRSFVYQLLMC